MTDRRIEEPRKAGPDAALVIVGAIAVLAAVRWLARLGRPALALIAAAIVVVLFAVWAVRPRRQLPRHRVRVMRLRARLRLHPGPGHATVFEMPELRSAPEPAQAGTAPLEKKTGAYAQSTRAGTDEPVRPAEFPARGRLEPQAWQPPAADISPQWEAQAEVQMGEQEIEL